MEGLIEVIEKAKGGDRHAKNDLVRMMLNDGCMKQLNRYLYVNRLLSASDVQGEFWLGVVKAIPVVKTDIGNPLQFLTWKGLNAVKSALRKNIRKEVYYTCEDCGHTHSIVRERGGLYKCQACGSFDIITQQRELPASHLLTALSYHQPTPRENILIKIDFNEKIGKLRITLSSQENRVLDYIMKGYDRTTCKNYIKEIAEEMGVSPQCVNQYLNRIKKKLLEVL